MVVGGIKSTDFELYPLKDFGIDVTLKAVTKSYDFDGGEQFTYANGVTIKAIYNPKVDRYVQQKLGLQEGTDAYIMVKGSQTVNKDDIIEAQGKQFHIIDVKERLAPAENISIYKFCELQFRKNL
jgi:hypothetical protein